MHVRPTHQYIIHESIPESTYEVHTNACQTSLSIYYPYKHSRVPTGVFQVQTYVCQISMSIYYQYKHSRVQRCRLDQCMSDLFINVSSIQAFQNSDRRSGPMHVRPPHQHVIHTSTPKSTHEVWTNVCQSSISIYYPYKHSGVLIGGPDQCISDLHINILSIQALWNADMTFRPMHVRPPHQYIIHTSTLES
jgi:hypothetical protein